jgi:beta-aspartyl-peptidase (threonine type)
MKSLGMTIIAAGLLVGALSGQNSPTGNSEAAIRQVLQSQVDAWNHHDLDSFMAGYWRSPDLTFFSGATETKGWEPTLARYRRNYQAEGRSMGALSFSDLQVDLLGPDAAFVRGRFQLVMPDGKQPSGLFTLIFRKFPEGWRIVHDHTCSDQSAVPGAATPRPN